MEIKNKNGFLKYSIEENEITLDLVKVDKKQKGTGSKLIAKLKKNCRKE